MAATQRACMAAYACDDAMAARRGQQKGGPLELEWKCTTTRTHPEYYCIK